MMKSLVHLYQAWESFISSHQLDPGINVFIAKSWERCWPRMSPYATTTLKTLAPEHLLSTQVANFNLLSICRPVMEDIYQYIEGSNSMVGVVDRTGFLLDLVGDESMIELADRHGIRKGSLLSEFELGTNAFALSLMERVPVQVRGPEHYRKQFHIFSESAAPIFDLNGKPLGSLGVFNLAEECHQHSLGMVVAGARAVEGQNEKDHLLDEQNLQLTHLNTILDTSSDGILLWKADGVLVHANRAASEILGINVVGLLGKRLSPQIQFPDFVQEAIRREKTLSDVEAQILVGGKAVDCSLSLRFVRSGKGMSFFVATLRRTQEIRQLVRRQISVKGALTLEHFVGKSPAIRQAQKLAYSAADARASVLIRGESGTGKSLLAQAIHQQGSRRSGPFIVFSCTAMPSETVISELLGQEGGDNIADGDGRPSKFELADGGTLFLQDVHALPLEAQAILLNVLELGIVQRLHSRRPIEVDVRVIAATSAPLEKLVREKSFRSDLFYRLSAFEIHLPPLRERKDDFPLLVEMILSRLRRKYQCGYVLDESAMTLMQKYSWPGNVRELETVLERAVVQAGANERIYPRHLPDYIQNPLTWIQVDGRLERVASLDTYEQEAILQAARYCRGNVTQMAEMLGIGRTTLWRRLKRYQIEPQDYRDGR